MNLTGCLYSTDYQVSIHLCTFNRGTLIISHMKSEVYMPMDCLHSKLPSTSLSHVSWPNLPRHRVTDSLTEAKPESHWRAQMEPLSKVSLLQTKAPFGGSLGFGSCFVLLIHYLFLPFLLFIVYFCSLIPWGRPCRRTRPCRGPSAR